MTLDEFWDHIDKSKRKDPDAHAERLEKRLAKLKPEEIIDFGYWWDVMHTEAYHWHLWAAAYLINGGCSDDGFHYFCNWLILRGRVVFQAAVSNPDTLADVVDPDEDEVEWDGSPGSAAWFTATKTKEDAAGYAALETAERARQPNRQPYPELGEGWDFDDDEEMRKRLPRLSALYTDGDADG
jgi:hypothetical protein